MALLELSDFYKLALALKPSPKTARAYLIGGDELYLKRELLSVLKQKLTPENPEFNNIHLDLEKMDIESIESEIKSYPMMADFKLVTIEISQATLDQKQKALFQMLYGIDLHDTYLIIYFEKSDLRKAFLTQAIQNFTCVECKTPYASQIPVWIQQIAQRYGLKFKEEAIALFHHRVGDSLSQIDLEIKKLQSFSSNGWVTEEIVQNLVVSSTESTVFESVHFFFTRDVVRCTQSFKQLMDSGESPILLVTLMARHTRLLLKYHSGRKANLSGPKLAQFLKVPPYFFKQYESEASQWTSSQLLNLIAHLAELDLKLKTRSQNSQEMILNWTLKQLQIVDI
jgi:DNA polymerase-3 subunit delta